MATKKILIAAAFGVASAAGMSGAAIASQQPQPLTPSGPQPVEVITPTTDTTTGTTTEQQINDAQRIGLTVQNHLFNIGAGRALEAAQFAGISQNGVSAGEQTQRIGQSLSVWSSASYNESENDSPGIAYDADTTSVSLGLDYRLGRPLTIGFFVSKSWTDTDSAFNGGGSETDGTTFGPYVSVTLADWLSADFSYALTNSDIDNRRVTPAGLTITGSQDSSTDFFSAGLNASHWYQNGIGVSGRLAYSYSETENDAYTDSTGTPIAASKTELGQVQIGGRVMYYMSNFMPYAGVTYINDINRDTVRTVANPQPANDEDDVLLQAGVSIFGDGPLSGGLDLSYNAAREENDAWGLGGSVSYAF